MTAQEKLAPLAAKLHAALADEKAAGEPAGLHRAGWAGAAGSWPGCLPGNSTQSPQTVQTDTAADYATQLESRLTALISRVEGLERPLSWSRWNPAVSIYATDTDADGASTHVLLGSGRADGLVETVQTPQVLGVAVVRGRRQRSRTEPRDRAGGDIDRRRREPHHRCKKWHRPDRGGAVMKQVSAKLKTRCDRRRPDAGAGEPPYLNWSFSREARRAWSSRRILPPMPWRHPPLYPKS